MPRYRVTLHFTDDMPFIWEGEARSQYRAELLAVAELRKTSSKAIVGITTVELE